MRSHPSLPSEGKKVTMSKAHNPSFVSLGKMHYGATGFNISVRLSLLA